MRTVSVWTVTVLATTLSGLANTEANACGWLRHCHRCAASSGSSISNGSSSTESQSGVISDIGTLLNFYREFKKVVDGDEGGQGDGEGMSNEIKERFDKIDKKLDGLDSLVKQVNANTEAIEALKVGQEAIANRADDKFATKTEVGELVEKAVEKKFADIDKKITDKIDERFDAHTKELNKDLDRRELKSAMSSLGARYRLKQDLKPFTGSTGTTQHSDTWQKGDYLRFDSEDQERLKVQRTFDDRATWFWVDKGDADGLDDLVKALDK